MREKKISVKRTIKQVGHRVKVQTTVRNGSSTKTKTQYL